MKTLLYKYLLLSVAALMFTSCATPRMFTTLDLLRPAEVTFEPGVKSVLVVNNSVVQPYNVGHYNLTANESKTSETLKFDSAALFCTAGLRENLEAKEFFNKVKIAQTNQNRTDNFYKITSLDKETVKFLCNLYQTDALIALDHLQTNDETDKYYGNFNMISVLDVKINTAWSIHYPNSTPSVHVQFSDDFSWEDRDASNLPNRYDALVDACILTGSNSAERMIPRWEKQDRYFYTPKKPLMQQAMDSVVTRNWKSAVALWQQASEQTKSFRIKFQAANNMAVAYEILGDIDNAIASCELAVKYYPYITIAGYNEKNNIYETLRYCDFLRKRKEEISLISKQLSE